MIRRPTSVDPVNATLSTSGLRTSSSPTTDPGPGTTFTTPGGIPASRHSSPSLSVDSGASSAGLITTVLPAAMAGAIFHAAICMAKFHGVIAAHTPIGSRRTQFVDPGFRGSGRSSSSRAARSPTTRKVEMTMPRSPPRAVRTVWPAS